MASSKGGSSTLVVAAEELGNGPIGPCATSAPATPTIVEAAELRNVDHCSVKRLRMVLE
jgi:hypothetical protein